MTQTDDVETGAQILNFRDAGGDALADGGRVRTGVLFRSANLDDLDNPGVQSLHASHRIGQVIDLRSEGESLRDEDDPADAVIPRRSFPFEPGRSGVAQSNPSQAHDRARLLAAYRTYPDLDGAGMAIRSSMEAIADGEVILVHCFAGKDRTGWLVATLLRAAGVPESAVLSDYLRSNDAVDGLAAMLGRRYPGAPLPDRDYLGVHEDYLRSADEVMRTMHGGLSEYLSVIGVDSPLLQGFRRRFIE